VYDAEVALGSPTMKVYIDTCVISGHAKGDLSTQEAEAFARLLTLHADGRVILLTSTVAQEEISRIPQEYRAPHESIYTQLENIPAVGYLVLDLGFGIPLLGVKQHSIYRSLANLVRDAGDAQHLYQAHCERASHFITVDAKTILSKAHEIGKVCNVEVLLPSAFVEKYMASVE
jgi:predicted nucleic acid-binding protein